MSAIMRFRSLCPKQMLLGIVSPSDSKLTSGGGNMERPLSSGQQTWQDKEEEWPLKQPLPKKTALLQVGGRVPHTGRWGGGGASGRQGGVSDTGRSGR